MTKQQQINIQAQPKPKPSLIGSGHVTPLQPSTSLNSVITMDPSGQATFGQQDNNGTSIIMKDVETGLKYKLVIRNGELCIEGAETQSIRDVKINTILK